MNRLTDTQEISNYLKLTYKLPWNISRKFEKDSPSRTGDITNNLFSVRKWGNKETDRHNRNLKLFRNSVQTFQECPQNIWDR